MIYVFFWTVVEDTTLLILRNQRRKSKNVRSQGENIPCDFPEKVLEPMLNFEAP
jgi:hypothetical protein